MTNYFVDSTTGDNGDNGTTMDLAWATVEYALESGGLSAGDYVWVRRIHSETPGSDIHPTYDGAADSPIQVIGWPRAAATGTASVENGFPAFFSSNVTPDREKHQARRIKNDTDGKYYLITAIGYYVAYDGQATAFVDDETIDNNNGFSGVVLACKDEGATGHVVFKPGYTGTLADDDPLDSSGTKRADANGAGSICFIIDREYAGSDAAASNFTIQADDDWYNDMGTQFGFDDSGWTIKEANWDADADDMPKVDFNDEAFQFHFSLDVYYTIKNMELIDSADGAGVLYFFSINSSSLVGCLLKQNAFSAPLISCGYSNLYLERVVIEGSGSGVNQRGISYAGTVGSITLKDCAIYNMGDNGILIKAGNLILNNVNLGVELSNGDDEIIYNGSGLIIKGQDVKLKGTNGYVSWSVPIPQDRVSIGNFQKVLGNNVTYFPGGAVGETGGFKNVDVGDANAPSTASSAGSTTDLIAIYPNVTGYEFIEDWAVKICEWKIWAAAAAETYTVYIQNNMGETLNDTAAKDNIWLRLRYIDKYDDTTEYHQTELFSTEIDILQRADQTDWDSLTIASHTPAVAGWAVLELFISEYAASGQIYVDPKWV